jgi:serine/threonine-protein kinase
VNAQVGKYRLLRRIAAGGMAEVFLATDNGVDLWAVKLILPHLADQPEFLGLFLDEARLAAQINHTNVVKVRDLGMEDSRLFIAMEYVRGQPLSSVLQKLKERNVEITPAEAAEMVAQSAAGLNAAHDAVGRDGKPLDLVHRDVSPQNLLLTEDGEIKVVDFGIAKARNKLVVTQANTTRGKPWYMSPEQMRGEPLDRRADIFSLGAVLFELLLGSRLFEGDVDQVMYKALNEPLPDIAKLKPDVPGELVEAIRRACARRPEDRYETAWEMEQELHAFAQGQGGTNLGALVLDNFPPMPSSVDEVTGIRPMPKRPSMPPRPAPAPPPPPAITEEPAHEPTPPSLDVPEQEAARPPPKARARTGDSSPSLPRRGLAYSMSGSPSRSEPSLKASRTKSRPPQPTPPEPGEDTVSESPDRVDTDRSGDPYQSKAKTKAAPSPSMPPPAPEDPTKVAARPGSQSRPPSRPLSAEQVSKAMAADAAPDLPTARAAHVNPEQTSAPVAKQQESSSKGMLFVVIAVLVAVLGGGGFLAWKAATKEQEKPPPTPEDVKPQPLMPTTANAPSGNTSLLGSATTGATANTGSNDDAKNNAPKPDITSMPIKLVLNPETQGRLRVTSSGWGYVVVDGNVMDATPCEIPIVAGKDHKVALSVNGATKSERKIKIKANEVAVVHFGAHGELGTPGESPSAAAEDAEGALIQRNTGRAIALYRESLQGNAENADVQKALGKLLANDSNSYANALFHLQNYLALRKHPKDEEQIEQMIADIKKKM